jgi:hypothetical protein
MPRNGEEDCDAEISLTDEQIVLILSIRTRYCRSRANGPVVVRPRWCGQVHRRRARNGSDLGRNPIHSTASLRSELKRGYSPQEGRMAATTVHSEARSARGSQSQVALELAVGWLILLVASACQKLGPSRTTLGNSYKSVAEARAHLPASCDPPMYIPMYIVDGVPQEDTVLIYAVPATQIQGIYLVQPSGVARCPVVMLNRLTKR